MRTKPTRAGRQFAADVSETLAELRVRRKLTQGQLAKKAGIDRKTINRIENWHFSPSLDTFFRICGALEVKPGDVINGKRVR